MTSRDEIIEHGTGIAEEYGGNLTVRQLYYQLVARGFLGSGQKEYKRVVTAIAKARMSGEMPFDWIVDRTRECGETSAFDSELGVHAALDQAREWILDMPEYTIFRSQWYGQPQYVVVGVEKEALAGVFDRPCKSLGVGLFVFRGYPSLSALYQLTEHIERAGQLHAEEAVLLYFGDHDPDGWEIPRSALRNIYEIAAVTGKDLPPLRLERVALNIDQIDEYDPPPFGAKVTSTRYSSYLQEHGTTEAWELDALRPDILQSLIRSSVHEHFDANVYKENEEIVEERRDDLKGLMRSPEWIESVFEGDME